MGQEKEIHSQHDIGVRVDTSVARIAEDVLQGSPVGCDLVPQELGRQLPVQGLALQGLRREQIQTRASKKLLKEMSRPGERRGAVDGEKGERASEETTVSWSRSPRG